MKGSKLFIIAGSALALLAVLLGVASLMGGGKSDAKDKPSSAKVRVVEITTDLPAYSILKPEDLIEKEVNQADAPADAASSIAAVVGQSYKSNLVAGQRLQVSMLQTPGLRNEIAVGKRAIALPVDEVSAMSGLVQDGDYVDVIFHARINLIRTISTVGNVEIPEDGVYAFEPAPPPLPLDQELEQYAPTGDPGSVFYIRDDIDSASNLEPVAKVMLQDLKVLRVVRPGDSFLGDGSKDASTGDATDSATSDQPMGQLVLEATPAQAEVLTFIQDKKHEYQVMVRNKDDHEQVSTKGVTFEILATDSTWDLPWPTTVTAAKSQKGS